MDKSAIKKGSVYFVAKMAAAKGVVETK